MKNHFYLFALLTLLFYQCSETKNISKTNTKPDFPINETALKNLSAERKKLYEELRASYTGGLDITMDSKTNSVLLIQMHGESTRFSKADIHESAKEFLTSFLPLIDLNLGLTELVLNENSNCSDFSLTFTRIAGGMQVFGGSLVLHFNENNELYQVENSMVSARFSQDKSGKPDDTNVNLDYLYKIKPGKYDAGKVPYLTVIIPVEETNSYILKKARLYIFQNSNGSFSQTYLVPDKNLWIGPFASDEPAVLSSDTVSNFFPLPVFHKNNKTGLVDFISYRPIGGLEIKRLPGENNPAEFVYRFLEEHPALFRLDHPRCKFKVASIQQSFQLPNITYVKMDEMHLGLPVFDAQLVFEIENHNRIMSVTGHTITSIYIEPTPKIPAEESVRLAFGILNQQINAIFSSPIREKIMTDVRNFPATATLGIFPGQLLNRMKLQNQLAYKVNLGEYILYLDANRGNEILTTWTINADLPRTHYVIRDAQQNDENSNIRYETDIIDGIQQQNITNPIADVNTANNAIPEVKRIYEAYGWYGLDRYQLDYIANVNVNITTSTNPNAHYDAVTKETYFDNNFMARDVLAHEFTHGIIDHSAHLDAFDEPGALNESFADIMAELIFPDPVPAGGLSTTWQNGATLPGGRVRNLTNPIPNSYSRYQVRRGNCINADTACDNGQVHNNSQITSLAMVLLCDGRNITDPGGTPAIAGTDIIYNGIGRQKLRDLVFESIDRLSPLSQMADAGLALWASCEAFYVNRKTPTVISNDPNQSPPAYTQNDADVVEQAFKDVGLDFQFVSGYGELEPLKHGRYDEIYYRDAPLLLTGCTVVDCWIRMRIIDGGTQTASLLNNNTITWRNIYGGRINSRLLGNNVKEFSAHYWNDFFDLPDFVPFTDPSDAGIMGHGITSDPRDCTSSPNGDGFFHSSVEYPATETLEISTGPFELDGTLTIGNENSGWANTCEVEDVLIELQDNGNFGEPGRTRTLWYSCADVSECQTCYNTADVNHYLPFPCNCVTKNKCAFYNYVGIDGNNPTSPDLRVTVKWSTNDPIPHTIKYKLVYKIRHPDGVECGF